MVFQDNLNFSILQFRRRNINNGEGVR